MNYCPKCKRDLPDGEKCPVCDGDSMAELKPCKCAGNKPTLITHWMEGKILESYVYCYGCGISADKYASKEQAIDAWNKRS